MVDMTYFLSQQRLFYLTSQGTDASLSNRGCVRLTVWGRVRYRPYWENGRPRALVWCLSGNCVCLEHSWLRRLAVSGRSKVIGYFLGATLLWCTRLLISPESRSSVFSSDKPRQRNDFRAYLANWKLVAHWRNNHCVWHTHIIPPATSNHIDSHSFVRFLHHRKRIHDKRVNMHFTDTN